MRTRQNAIATPAKKNRKKKTSSLATQKQATGKKKSKATPAKKTRRKKKDKNSAPLALRILCLGIEITSLFFVAITSLVILIGYGAYFFSGTSLLYNLLPFAMGTLLVVSLAIGLFLGGRRMRPFLLNLHPYVPSCCAVALALGAILLLSQRDFSIPFDNFRLLVGGKEEARMATLKHQVFAAYRRLDKNTMLHLISRAQIYDHDIEDAALAYNLDPDLLNGLAATESSFLPRESDDGGQGLFQITKIPASVQQEVQETLKTDALATSTHRQNAFLAAATLRYYLKRMSNSLDLGLLAYNIGPANGGLQFIMQQYGATDFITLQPYLQEAPRAYPIRVLANALAFRLYRRDKQLLPYQEGLNAIHIQHIGIPGLE